MIFSILEAKTKNSGCGFFIKDDITVKVRNDLSIVYKSNEEEFEILSTELTTTTGNIIASIVYRHPIGNKFQHFYSQLEWILKKTHNEKQKTHSNG